MAVIRDREKVVKKIEEILKKHKDTLRWCKIDKIKVENKYTGNIDELTDIYAVAKGETSHRPMLICAFKDNRNVYVLHDEIAHVNVGSLDTFRIPNSKTHVLMVRAFCNPVTQYHIWTDPEKAKKILAGNLTDENPNSPMRSGIKSTHIGSSAYMITSSTDGAVLKNDINILQMAGKTYDVVNLSTNALEYLNEKITMLKEDHDLCLAYYANKSEVVPYYDVGLIRKDHMDDYLISSYYKTYDYTDITEEMVIPKKDVDVCCVGAGSAGSNIIEQLIKLNYFDKYFVIDFDYVERKNLRNQIYTKNDIGNSKAEMLTKHIRYDGVTDNLPNYKRCKYEDFATFEMYKYKYIISGFDSIECRKGLLDKIKSGEIDTKYLIDARYNGLDSSLFMVDTENEDEMKYYEKLLLETDKELKEEKAKQPVTYDWTFDQILDEHSDKIFAGYCSKYAIEYGINKDKSRFSNICHCLHPEKHPSCGSTTCLEILQEAFKQFKVPAPYVNTCTSANIIHIYKLTSAWVTSNIRSIETEKKKLFTHVEITTDPIPNAIVIRK